MNAPLIARSSGLNLLCAMTAKFPEKLIVHGDFEASFSEFQTLPVELDVHGDMCLEESTMEKISSKKLHVGRDLDVSNSAVRELPDDLTIGGRLILRGSEVTGLPARLRVDGYIDLTGSKVLEIPDGTQAGVIYADANQCIIVRSLSTRDKVIPAENAVLVPIFSAQEDVLALIDREINLPRRQALIDFLHRKNLPRRSQQQVLYKKPEIGDRVYTVRR